MIEYGFDCDPETGKCSKNIPPSIYITQIPNQDKLLLSFSEKLHLSINSQFTSEELQVTLTKANGEVEILDKWDAVVLDNPKTKDLLVRIDLNI